MKLAEYSSEIQFSISGLEAVPQCGLNAALNLGSLTPSLKRSESRRSSTVMLDDFESVKS
jgi:hypothetical protein